MTREKVLMICILLVLHHLLFAQADTPEVIHVFASGNKLAKKNDLLGIISSTGKITYPFELYNSTKT